MRVLLVQSKPAATTNGQVLLPLGLLYVATALMNRKHEVRVYDTNLSTAPIVEIGRLIQDFEPEIIGVGLRNLDTSRHTRSYRGVGLFLELVSVLKEAAPASRIVAGGAGFSIYARQLMGQASALDYGIVGEGEEALLELLDNLDQPQSVRGILHRHDDAIHFTGSREPVDFANLTPPRWDMVDLSPYLEHPFSIGVQTKRGCPFKCAYCNYPYLQGATLRMRSAQSVVDELEELSKQYGLRTLYFVDSVFNAPPSYTRGLLEEMLARGLALRWHGYSALNFVDAEYMKLAKEAGCTHFELSPDGISRSTLTALNKNITEQDIERVYSAAREIDGITVSFNFLINGPGESVRNIIRLIVFVLRCKLVLRAKASALVFSLIRIYPHTPLHALALETGMLREDDDLIRPVYYNPPPLRYVLMILFPIVRLALRARRALSRLVPS